jgi:guanylate kinase
VRSISATTRAPRSGEKQGVDYFFISKKDFFVLRDKKAFLEWARVFGQYYGTPRSFIKQMFLKGKDVLLSIDVQGAAKVRRIYPQGIYIFILPPSLKALEERLRKRGLDSHKEIERRIKLARHEIAHHPFYNYAVVNDNLSRAVKKLKAIINREKKRN